MSLTTPTSHHTNSHLADENAPPPEEAAARADKVSRARWGRRVAVLVVILVVAAAVGYLSYDRWIRGTDDETGAESAGTDVATAGFGTAAVEVRDLVETKRLSGNLGYESAFTVVSRASGSTSTPPVAGASIERGDQLFRVDGRPTIAMYGESAGWRELASGVAAGEDIRQLEQNLSALGHDEDEKLIIDTSWDAATTAAVKSWQRSIGVTDDGTVRLSDVVFLPGPGQVTAVDAIRGAGVGDGSPLLSYQAHHDTDHVVSQRTGNVSALALVGTAVEAGTELVAVNTNATYALIADDVHNSRTLTADSADGNDIRALEENLVAMGYDTGGDITVDRTWDEGTTEAVKRWQAALGLEQTGSTSPELFQFVEPDSVVTRHVVDVGDEVSGDAVVIEVGRNQRRIDASISVADQDLVAIGTPVEISVDGGAGSSGVITEIATTAVADETGDSSIALRIEADDPAAFGDLVEAPVRVTIVSKRTEAVLAVPSAALVGLVGGGHAVEIIDQDGSKQLYAVELGEAADGWIEITAGSIAEGQMVVLPL